MPNFAVWGSAMLLAAAIAAGLSLASRKMPATTPTGLTQITALCAAFLGACAGLWLADIIPHLLPTSGLDRLLAIVIPATIVSQLFVTRRLPAVSLASLSIGGLCITRVLLHGSIHLNENALRASIVILVPTALFVVVSVATLELWDRTASRAVPISTIGAVLVAAALVLLGGYLRGACAVFICSAAIGGAGIGCVMEPPVRDRVRPLLVLALVLLYSTLVIGYFFGNIDASHAISTLAALLVAWLPNCCVKPDRAANVITISRIGLVLVALAVVLWSAKRRFDREMAPHLSYVDTECHDVWRLEEPCRL